MSSLSHYFPTLIIKRFNEIGINTIYDFICTDPKTIATKLSVPQNIIEELNFEILNSSKNLQINGADLYLNPPSCIKTGCKKFDDLFSGGIFTREITEIAGKSSTGKTQFCFTLIHHLAYKNKSNICYIDTSNSFSAMRLKEIHENYIKNEIKEDELGENDQKNQEDPYDFLFRIRVAKLFNIFDLFKTIKEISSQKLEFFQDIKLLVIDSISHISSPIISKATRGRELISFLSHDLKKIANDLDIAILITNAFVSVDLNRKKHKPALGEMWYTVPSVRLEMDYQWIGDGNVLCAKITRSPRVKKENSLIYQIDESGIHGKN
ncbi:DNA repair protein rad51 [Anaeramoeba ignava]|uniref:DNA repair protein rad51 n=1 Tax=Anaeramoeba ignava TaxID=1746090 RepID=A0A9Q0L545_ANAIG|nr:DNA repair protein rad51 [Anaeramoeba ignava]